MAISHHSEALAISGDAMRRSKRRLPIPQHEFGFTPDTFNLMIESALDGERITREREEADRLRRLAQQAQRALPMPDGD